MSTEKRKTLFAENAEWGMGDEEPEKNPTSLPGKWGF
jgi:hypothetical protein